MPNVSGMVKQRVAGFNESMRAKSKTRRIAACMDFVFDLEDLRWVTPRHAKCVWETWEPVCRRVAEFLTASYHATMKKPGAEGIRITAYPIGQRSKCWPRYRKAYKNLGRLPAAYWAKITGLPLVAITSPGSAPANSSTCVSSRAPVRTWRT